MITKLAAELLERNKSRTDAQLAADLGISAAHVSHIRAGRRQLSIDLIGRVLRLYPELEDIHLDDLKNPKAQEAVA